MLAPIRFTMIQDQIAKTKEEWWELMKNKLVSFNSGKDSDDQLSLLDFVGEYSGEKIFGWIPYRNSKGDLDINTSEFDYGDDEDDYDDDEDYFNGESSDSSQRYVDEEDD